MDLTFVGYLCRMGMGWGRAYRGIQRYLLRKESILYYLFPI